MQDDKLQCMYINFFEEGEFLKMYLAQGHLWYLKCELCSEAINEWKGNPNNIKDKEISS